jgi:hypothetical protein
MFQEQVQAVSRALKRARGHLQREYGKLLPGPAKADHPVPERRCCRTSMTTLIP